MNQCCVCTKDILGTTWFCNECAIENDLVDKKSVDWPDWVKGLRHYEQQRRRKVREMLESGFSNPIHYGTIEDLESMVDSEVISAN